MEQNKRKKGLTPKQRQALELLTCGKGISYKEIAEIVGVSPKTLWEWRNGSDFVNFQEELKRLNDARWCATVDAAREAALRLCREGKADFVKFVLQNEGYNPTQKIDADINTDVIINIE